MTGHSCCSYWETAWGCPTFKQSPLDECFWAGRQTQKYETCVLLLSYYIIDLFSRSLQKLTTKHILKKRAVSCTGGSAMLVVVIDEREISRIKHLAACCCLSVSREEATLLCGRKQVSQKMELLTGSQVFARQHHWKSLSRGAGKVNGWRAGDLPDKCLLTRSLFSMSSLSFLWCRRRFVWAEG